MERPNEPDYIQHMRRESKELKQKFDKLTEFLRTASYQNLSDHAKDLILTQRGMMIGYTDILSKRIALAIREENPR